MAGAVENNGEECLAERSKSGLRKSSTLKMLENCVGSNSSTPRISSTRKPSRTRVRNWKHQLLPLFFVKLWRIVGVVDLTKFRQNLRVFWKPMNPPECVWEIRCRIITKTILQEKVRIHYSTTILVHKFIPMPQAVKILAAKAAVNKEWEKLEKISA